MERAVEKVASFLKWLNPNLPDNIEYEKSSVFGSWFLSPRQHAVELALYTVLIISSILILRHFAPKHSRLSKSFQKMVYSHLHPRNVAKNVNQPYSCAICIFSFVLELLHKIHTNALPFMLQPCHVSLVLLGAISLMKKESMIRTRVFNIYLYIAWGGALAVVQPDLRGRDNIVFVINFWIEHAVILLLPLVWVFNGDIVVWKFSFALGITSYLIMAAYHSWLLVLVSIYMGLNLNYVMVPPPGFLQQLDKYYRPAMYLMCFPLTLFFRRFVIESMLFIVRKLQLCLGKEINEPETPVSMSLYNSVENLLKSKDD